MPRPRPALLAVAAGLAISGAGCGGDDQQKVRQTLRAYQRATAARDYGTLCTRVLAAKLVTRLAKLGLPCEVALERGLRGVTAPRLTIRRIRIRGDVALALVRTSAAGQRPSEDTIELVREGDEWRVSTLAGSQPPSPRSAP
jgi:hypothetical protein